jgi:hypothetical protein
MNISTPALLELKAIARIVSSSAPSWLVPIAARVNAPDSPFYYFSDSTGYNFLNLFYKYQKKCKLVVMLCINYHKFILHQND